MARVAVITGGTRGMGLAIAERLAADGWALALLYRSDEDAAADALDGVARAVAYRCDVRDPASLKEVFAQVHDELGPIEALVTCAFRSRKEAMKTHDVSVESWVEDLDTNLTGSFLSIRAAIPHFLRNHAGSIVCLGSLAARGEPGRVAYATSKAGLEGLVKTVAHEYARDNITANVVHPGFFEVGAFMRLSPEIQERALKRVPMRRAGRAEEIGATVAYLLSPGAAYLSGQVINLDGATR